MVVRMVVGESKVVRYIAYDISGWIAYTDFQNRLLARLLGYLSEFCVLFVKMSIRNGYKVKGGFLFAFIKAHRVKDTQGKGNDISIHVLVFVGQSFVYYPIEGRI